MLYNRLIEFISPGLSGQDFWDWMIHLMVSLQLDLDPHPPPTVCGRKYGSPCVLFPWDTEQDWNWTLPQRHFKGPPFFIFFICQCCWVIVLSFNILKLTCNLCLSLIHSMVFTQHIELSAEPGIFWLTPSISHSIISNTVIHCATCYASCTRNLNCFAQNMTVLMNACALFRDDMRNALLRVCM